MGRTGECEMAGNHDESTQFLHQLVGEWRPERSVKSIAPLTPDASLRRYFRIVLDGGESYIGVIYDSVAAPEVGGAEGARVNSFDAFVLVTERLQASGIPVPRLFFAQREPYGAILEDLGDVVLASAFEGGAERREESYRAAIEILLRLQPLAAAPGEFFAFQRRFTPATYRHEMEEFSEFFLAPTGLPVGEFGELLTTFSHRLEQYPRVVVHRDFHSWNLMVDPAGAIRVIDYQDLLLGSRCYDVVALLNDRDTDAALGPELHAELLRYFLCRAGEQWGVGESELEREFLEHSLQRDLKVVGRFSKLVRVRGLHGYQRWIPGTLNRLRRTLQQLAPVDPLFRQLSAEVERFVGSMPGEGGR
jgi:aminoglycoside/choline kinase family phosphotransferase